MRGGLVLVVSRFDFFGEDGPSSGGALALARLADKKRTYTFTGARLGGRPQSSMSTFYPTGLRAGAPIDGEGREKGGAGEVAGGAGGPTVRWGELSVGAACRLA